MYKIYSKYTKSQIRYSIFPVIFVGSFLMIAHRQKTPTNNRQCRKEV